MFEAKAGGPNKKAPKLETLLEGYVTIMVQLQEHMEMTASKMSSCFGWLNRMR